MYRIASYDFARERRFRMEAQEIPAPNQRDGEIKAPPSVWRMWLVGFIVLGNTGHCPSGSPSQNTNTFNASSASRPVSYIGCHHDKARR